jgi:hypothetical protein
MLPPYQAFSSDADYSEALHSLQCVARVGVRGCAFEQPLEAMWKALAPSSETGGGSLYTFAGQTRGQGDRANAGFLREDAVLVVVHLTDEDDCSMTDKSTAMITLSDVATGTYGALNLRCAQNMDDESVLRSTDRYVEALRALKPRHPERVVFAAVVGVPESAIEAHATPDDILSLPELQIVEQTAANSVPDGVLRPSCVSAGGAEPAYPPVRFVKLAKALGDQAVLGSICADDYAPVIDQVLDKVALQLGAP